ncbi:MAG: hypothetical protein ACI4E1_11590 [Lachnospira sp.]
MAEGNNIHDEVKAQRKKFKTLSFTEKVGYIWQYYKLPIFSIILVTLAVISFVVAYRRNNYDTVFYVAVVDGYIENSSDDTDALTTGFTEYLGIDGKKEQADFDYGYTFVYDELGLDKAGDVSVNKIYTLAYTSNLDGLLASYDYMWIYSTDSGLFLSDLRALLSEEEMETLEDMEDVIIYYERQDGEKIPFAVDLTKSDVISASGLQMEHPSYGVIASAPNADNATDFIRYAFNL